MEVSPNLNLGVYIYSGYFQSNASNIMINIMHIFYGQGGTWFIIRIQCVDSRAGLVYYKVYKLHKYNYKN